jgi:iron(II)-dependent oxidoreductase
LEWTRSLWGENPLQPDYGYPYTGKKRERERLDAPDNVLRVLRGGLFAGNVNLLRAAARRRVTPGDRKAGIGFRVVVSRPRS